MSNYLAKDNNPDSKVQAIINMVEVVPNFIQQWPVIDSQYKETFQFADPLTDDERMKEYQEVNKYYKKYISEKKKDVLQLINRPEQLINQCNVWLETDVQQPGRGWSRWFIVYTKMYKEWLLVLRKFAQELLELNKTYKEE